MTAATTGDLSAVHGYTGRIRDPRPKSLRKLKATLRPKTKRANGRSLEAIIVDVNATLRGWFGYFRHCHWTVFRDLDAWLRGRLRSILRKRRHPRGRARGRDHQRWPNAFFTEQGLYSLSAAHVSLCQSCLRQNHPTESRMREIRTSGSEGGGTELNRSFLPLPNEKWPASHSKVKTLPGRT